MLRQMRQRKCRAREREREGKLQNEVLSTSSDQVRSGMTGRVATLPRLLKCRSKIFCNVSCKLSETKVSQWHRSSMEQVLRIQNSNRSFPRKPKDSTSVLQLRSSYEHHENIQSSGTDRRCGSARGYGRSSACASEPRQQRRF